MESGAQLPQQRGFLTKCILIGLAAGLANGLFGAGGGLLLVPGFCGWLHLTAEKAMPTSIAVIFPLCIVSAVFYRLQDSLPVDWWILTGGLLGGILGGILYGKVNKLWLRRALGALILYSALRMLFF